MRWIKDLYASMRAHIRHSTEIVLAIISGLVGLSQFIPGNALPATSFWAIDNLTVTAILGVMYLIAGGTLFIGFLGPEEGYYQNLRRIGSFVAFLCFSYTAMLSAFSDELTLSVGVMAGGLAIISAILHVQEKYGKT